MLSRREWLRAVGAGAATAALAPLGCGAGRRGDATMVEASPEAMRQALRDAVTLLGERLDAPQAWVLRRRRVRALVDVAGAEVVEEHVTVAVLAARDADGRRIERCFDEVTPARIAQVAEVIGAGRGLRRGRPKVIPPPVDHGATVDADPARLAHTDWLTRARDVAARGDRAATSRIVYRAAWLVTDDDRVWSVGERGDQHQRLVRSRIGATFVAWHGSTPQHGEAAVVGGYGPAVARLDDAAIARAADDALALFTPGAPPAGRQVVLLDPGVVAALVDAYLAAGRPPALAPPFVAVVDDPTVPGFARHWFDDDGVAARVVPLVGAQVAGAAGPARRAAPAWRLTTAPAQLLVAGGAESTAKLEAGIDAGLVIEGLRDVRLDDRGAVVARVARGRQLQGGVRTGRQWGDLEVRGAVHELLADGFGVSRERAEVAVGDDGAPRSVTAPWLLTRAHVGSARGPA